MGGLTPEEAVCILEDRPFERMGMTYATLRLMELVQQWKGRNTPVFQAPPISTRLEHALGLVQRLRDGRAIPHRAHWNELEAILQAAIAATPPPSPHVMGWRTMDSAPVDGSPFVAVDISRYPVLEHVHVYKWDGPPNYWHCRRLGICIRPDYQDRYRWASLPALATATEGSGE
jgi:hypothetical protein